MDHGEERHVPRVVLYQRVSRVDQNPRLQADETEAYVERRGWVVVGTYVDHGVSGSRDRRPELDRLLADARKRRFDILVVWRSDRLCRSLRHMVNCLAELNALGVKFVSVTEPFDGTTPQGQLLLHLVAAFAEFERHIIIERTRAGLQAARRRGARIGRPRVRLDTVRLGELRNQGWSIRRIATHLKVGIGTVQRALSADPEGSVPKPTEDA